MRRYRIYFILLCIILLALLGYALLHSREPSYEGRTLSEWMEKYASAKYLYSLSTVGLAVSNFRYIPEGDIKAPDRKSLQISLEIQMDRASNAIYRIGPKAIPYLLNWIDYEQPDWNKRLVTYFGNHWGSFGQQVSKFLFKRTALKNESVEAFQILGPAAEDAIPGLAKLLNSPKPTVAENAARALRYIGPKGLPPLMKAFDGRSRVNRSHLASYIIGGSSGTNLFRFLAKAMKDPDPDVRSLAVSGPKRIEFSQP
jgi:hypothetical protein